MIEKLSSDICNEHVAKVMEVLVSLARVAPVGPPACESSHRYLCPEMLPHDTPALHV